MQLQRGNTIFVWTNITLQVVVEYSDIHKQQT